ncbi:molybdopterin molybdotransferase [Polymorphobacter multimanifer]|uniref:Molybdopterin molybdenumtransferase n=1 Tax=Polymorphobacter multimanifer TaxID=1070431 RepID=A0A841LGB2_9SPHN|nr:gephyrin-like molybdotransferase Glp [Polymorphobacter multimanifer]MBB6228835.1 molybdopterin molybdotransferase [Polymorphobacter multimanifer]
MSLLHPDEALARLLASAGPLGTETLLLAVAAGRIAAEPVHARLTQPPFAASAMDGWAVRWADMPGPFRIIGESAAGHGFAGHIGTGETVRIFTGAPLPAGADTVIVQEEVHREGQIAILSGEGPPTIGAHIRKAGQDFAEGSSVITQGTRLTARHLGLLAAAGHGSVRVLRRPRVTLIATGDELVPPGTRPGPGQIISSNGVMLAALFTAAGAHVTDLGIIPDDSSAIAAGISGTEADLIVTIGGASVGDHDLIIPVLQGLGATLDFWKIAMRPGKPLIAGALGSTRILGLPGNPVSAYVCALLFGWPLVRALGGRATELPTIRAPLAVALPASGNRRDHLRAWLLPDGSVQPAPAQDSAQLAALAQAEVLIIREAHAPPAETGETVTCIALDMFSDVA